MPGRSLDTSGLCVTNTRLTEVPHTHWLNAGALSGGGGGGGASGYAGASAGTSSTYSSGVTATGTGGGIQYTISGIPSYYVNLSVYFSALAGSTQVRVYSGSGTSGTQLASVNVSYTSPATVLSLGGVATGGGTGTITVVVSTPPGTSYGSSTDLFSIDSIGYSWVTYTLASSLYTQCGDPKDKYEFGFDGKYKDNEIAGVGNYNTALFWEYDTRLGRRWNLDPVKNYSESPYSVFTANPLLKNDIQGDESIPTAPAPPFPILRVLVEFLLRRFGGPVGKAIIIVRETPIHPKVLKDLKDYREAQAKIKREASETSRRKWEKYTGQKWPKEPNDPTRNQSVSHKKALKDGGTDEPENIEPKPWDEHRKMHKENGDYSRWAKDRWLRSKNQSE